MKSRNDFLKLFSGKYIFFLILLFASSLQARSQKFPASAIADSLKENANVVVRLDETTWDIQSASHATVTQHFVYTILNEKGDGYAVISTHYNSKSISINSISAYLYDANGKEINHFKKKDMTDLPNEDGSSFVNDERYKSGSFNYSHYPYTVEFEVEMVFNGFMHISDWVPQQNFMLSVETSRFTIQRPADYPFKYRMLNSSLQPVIVQKGNKQIYTWQLQNLTAYEEMTLSADYVWSTPHLLISPGEINIGGYTGSLTSWNEFGKFYGSMQKGRDILPDETKQKVKDLVNGLTDPASKIAVLYNYLQQNTHYVNVQLGIGGWQASDATYVANKKYGDCKALSNFMVSLLREACIKGYSVLVEGGKEDMDFVPDFTYDPFNHAICCVPLGKDTIWLECTDQFLPPGYLSWFTANRYALLITDDGGVLVHTPAYLLSDNIRKRNISAKLDNDGNMTLESKTMYRALCQDRIEGIIHHKAREEQLKILKSIFYLPSYEVISFNYREDYSKRLPVIDESLQLSVNNYAQVTGKRIFINPNILSRSGTKYAEDKNRRLDIQLIQEYSYTDTVQITIPTGYEVESQMKNQEIKSPFGSYSNKTQVMSDKIIYYRKVEQYSGRYPATRYEEYVGFYNTMYDADHEDIVLVRKN